MTVRISQKMAVSPSEPGLLPCGAQDSPRTHGPEPQLYRHAEFVGLGCSSPWPEQGKSFLIRALGCRWVAGLVASAAFCTAVLVPMMGMPLYEPLAAVILALLVAVLAVRALGETDLNPVSGVGKLSQVSPFACLLPKG